MDQQAPVKTVTIRHKSIINESWMTPGLMKSSRTGNKLYKKSIGHNKSHIYYRNQAEQETNFIRKVLGIINPIYIIKHICNTEMHTISLHAMLDTHHRSDIRKNMEYHELCNWPITK